MGSGNHNDRNPEETNITAGVIQRAATKPCSKACDGECSKVCAKVTSKGSGWSRSDSFGDVSVSYLPSCRKAEQATTADLEIWVENVLNVETLDEVFNSGFQR